MTTADNGGPAFPDPGRAQSEKQREKLTDTGMTLRDYFAAKALPEVYGRVTEGGFERVAQLSYQMADAMLAERAR